MNPLDKNFNWLLFFQFSLPYGLLMALFNPEWGVTTIFLSSAFFGYGLMVLLSPPEKHESLKSEDFDGQFQGDLLVAHQGAKKKMLTFLSASGIVLFSLMGFLSLFIDLIDPVGAENFNKTLHIVFFFGLTPLFYAHLRSLNNYALISHQGLEINCNKPFLGSEKRKAQYHQIQSTEVNIWGSVIVNFHDQSKLYIPAIFGLDLSDFKDFDTPEQEIFNPNFKGSYQIKFFIDNKIQESQQGQPDQSQAA